ncbi:MAG: type IV pili methyl-accepting chemotaxis transducer N-terminal domain-containing protein [Gammaproteobacteria bacterium]|nr:type IV pili methyl-accepting chemotaxis transducer N-terminal domain-containing protein [Gammaproteobacteria bacterium]
MTAFVAGIIQRVFMILNLKTLTNQFFVSFIVILIFGVFILSSLILSTSDDANGINIAGRQRMLSQRLAKESILVANKVAQRSEVQKTIDLFESSHHKLLNGDVAANITAVSDINIISQLKKVERLWNTYKEGLLSYIDAPNEQGLNEIYEQSPVILKQMNKAVVMMTEKATKRMEAQKNITIYSTIALVLLMFLGRIYGTHYLMNKIFLLKEHINKVSNGDFSAPIELDESENEITDTIIAYNTMLDNVGEMISGALSVANNIVDGASHASSSLKQTEDAVIQQDSDLDEVLNAMNKMNDTVDDVSSITNESSSIANETESQAKEGQKVVSIAMDNMNMIATQVDEASDVMHELDKDSQQVGQVLAVITGIAEQTNLLALNAAIEAARAGEQGRGFAVVADEVRTLAQRTQESTEQIKEIIDRLQSQAQRAVSVIVDTKGKTDQSVQSASEASSMLVQIVGSVSNIRNVSHKINEAILIQNNVAVDVKNRIDSISKVASNTKEATKVSVDAAKGIESEINKLRELMSHFKT